jgi:FAD/FMN-containing dehydrogenase
MTRTMGGALETLRAELAGTVIGPADPGYDDARRVWNGEIDRRPAGIARCAHAADVSTAIGVARAAGLGITVRGGAHNAAGSAVADDALMIDLRYLDGVVVDPVTRTARVGGGATLAQLDAATAEHGLATVGGTVSHTGVGGLTLGGGMGWLTGEFGLAVDNLLAVQIVTADGAVRRCASDEHADLFWAVRGGGGNFGVVTEFVFRLHELDPMVRLGFFFWTADRAAEALRLARAVLADLPPGLSVLVAGIDAPAAPWVPSDLQGVPGWALVLVGFDGTPRHPEFVERIRAALPPAVELVTPTPYVALQQMFDEGNEFGSVCYEKGSYVAELGDGVLDVLVEHLPRRTNPRAHVLVQPLLGAYTRVPEEDTAFGGGRSARLFVSVVGMASDPALLAPDRAWVRELWSALQPYAMGEAAYVNTLEPRDADRIRASYGPKYARLQQVKAVYDPDNVFHRNVNIPPAGKS